MDHPGGDSSEQRGQTSFCGSNEGETESERPLLVTTFTNNQQWNYLNHNNKKKVTAQNKMA